MKKIISIPLIVLILFTGINVKFAIHYCGGYVADTKISLSGELATCGMESASDLHSSEAIFTRHCCDDIVADYVISNIYIPSLSLITEYFPYSFQVLSIPDGLTDLSSGFLKPLFTYVSPPWVLRSTSVDLSDICVFRI